MNLIVAVDKNWAIGNKGRLLVSIPGDHKMFRRETLGKVVVYGRKTLETFPMQQPLDRRTNIVLSANPKLQVRGAAVVHSIPELLEELKQYDSSDIYIIGGESVYRQMLPYCDTAYVTKVHTTVDSDTYFPNLDEMDDWHLADIVQSGEENGIAYEMCLYKRKGTA